MPATTLAATSAGAAGAGCCRIPPRVPHPAPTGGVERRGAGWGHAFPPSVSQNQLPDCVPYSPTGGSWHSMPSTAGAAPRGKGGIPYQPPPCPLPPSPASPDPPAAVSGAGADLLRPSDARQLLGRALLPRLQCLRQPVGAGHWHWQLGWGEEGGPHPISASSQQHQGCPVPKPTPHHRTIPITEDTACPPPLPLLVSPHPRPQCQPPAQPSSLRCRSPTPSIRLPSIPGTAPPPLPPGPALCPAVPAAAVPPRPPPGRGRGGECPTGQGTRRP
jgi:hypothetical protein